MSFNFVKEIVTKSTKKDLLCTDSQRVFKALREIKNSYGERKGHWFYQLLGLEPFDYQHNPFLVKIINDILISSMLHNQGGFRKGTIDRKHFFQMLTNLSFDKLEQIQKQEEKENETTQDLDTENLEERFAYLNGRMEKILEKFKILIDRKYLS